MNQARLMAIFAHPDDEAFGTGGTLATYASEGIDVTLVCATRGEAGEIAEGSGATPENLGQVREAELRCSAEKMGIARVIFLGYRDSGMIDSPENADPRAFINAPADGVVPQLVQIMRQYRPHVVVTFEPNGGYGHPDHIAIHQHTHAAFRVAGDASAYPDKGVAWSARRLFYTAIPRSFFLKMRDEMAAMGIDTTPFEHLAEGDRGWPDSDVQVGLDVSAVIDAKWAALNCHRTQFGPSNLFRALPEPVVKKMISSEHFALAWPEVPAGTRLPGLFDGLTFGDEG